MSPLLAIMGIGPMEMMIVGIIAVLLFGSRLPAMAKSFGQAIPSFRKGMAEVESEIKEIERAAKV